MNIVEKMESQIGDDPQHIFDHEALFKLAIVEIERRDRLLAIAGVVCEECGEPAHDAPDGWGLCELHLKGKSDER